MSEDVIFCGVFDGHGPHGHLVARKVRDALPIQLLSILDSCESKQNGSGKACFKGNLKPDGEEAEKDCSAEDKLNSLWQEAFLKAYKAMDKDLKSHPNLDCFCSGSTSVSLVKQVMQILVYAIILYLSPSPPFLTQFSICRAQICLWQILGILEQSWDPRTAMIPWWRFS